MVGHRGAGRRAADVPPGPAQSGSRRDRRARCVEPALLAPDSVVLADCYVRPREGGWIWSCRARTLRRRGLARLAVFSCAYKCTLELRRRRREDPSPRSTSRSSRAGPERTSSRGLTPHTFRATPSSTDHLVSKGLFHRSRARRATRRARLERALALRAGRGSELEDAINDCPPLQRSRGSPRALDQRMTSALGRGSAVWSVGVSRTARLLRRRLDDVDGHDV